jgi:hypothetical protein
VLDLVHYLSTRFQPCVAKFVHAGQIDAAKYPFLATVTIDIDTYQSLLAACAMKVLVHTRHYEFGSMTQTIQNPTPMVSDRAAYEDADFSDTEMEALMQYFRVGTYQGLKTLLAAMRKSNLGY